jgi:hypothetical protein
MACFDYHTIHIQSQQKSAYAVSMRVDSLLPRGCIKLPRVNEGPRITIIFPRVNHGASLTLQKVLNVCAYETTIQFLTLNLTIFRLASTNK